MTTEEQKRQEPESEQPEPGPAESAAPSVDGQGADAAGQTAGEQGDSPEALRAEIEDLRRQLQESQDLYMRAQAETENVRRRARRDVEQAHKYSLERFVAELLPVKDSLEMGVQAARGEGPAAAGGDVQAQASEEVEALREGTELTLKMFEQALEKFGVEEVNPVGEAFDPQVHEAVSTQQTADARPDTVVAVMQKGYLLNKRVIRPAMVVVAQAPQEGEDQSAGG